MTYTEFSVVSSCPFLVVILQFEFVNVKNLLIVEKIGAQIEKKSAIKDEGYYVKKKFRTSGKIVWNIK